MTYELAKKLKDAGFPQKANVYLHENGDYSNVPSSDNAYVPTLSELIEECGNLSFQLELDFAGGTWRARGSVGWGAREAVGSTPEEAVANLWLTLQNKEK